MPNIPIDSGPNSLGLKAPYFLTARVTKSLPYVCLGFRLVLLASVGKNCRNWLLLVIEIITVQVPSISFLSFLTTCYQNVDLDLLNQSLLLILLCSLSAMCTDKERGSHWLDLNTISHTHQNYPLANVPTYKISLKVHRHLFFKHSGCINKS